MPERPRTSNSSFESSAQDSERLDALASFEILDTPSEAAFDDVVLLASELCGAAIATVTFVTGDRQWFKARTGTDACQSPIHESICNHALSSPDLLVIPDLTADARTMENPLVTGGPLYRFYAGAPLRARCGATLGTICVIDLVARPLGLTDGQAKVLRVLARQVMHLLEQRRSARASEARYRTVFDSAIDYAIVVMDLEGKVTDWNEGATRILGWTPEEVRGKPADIFFTQEDREAGIPGEEMRSALDVGRGNDERWHLRKDGGRFWANGEMMALRNDDDQAIGFLKILRDRTEQRAGVARLQASEARLRTIVETVPVGILFAEAPSGRIVGRNGRMQEIVGVASDVPKAIDDFGQWRSFHADGRLVEEHEYPLARVIREDIEEDSLEVHYERRDGSRIWIELTAAPVRDDDGSVAGAVVAVSDIDSRKRAEVAQNFMNGELSHRMKNLMAIVISITSQTMRSATDVAIAREVLSERLITLSKAHDILLGGPSERTPLADIVRSALGSYADESGRVEIGGPSVVIGQRAALALAMMVHELTTNAAKYGALSSDIGHVAVSWSLIDRSGTRDLRIQWREACGPTVKAPTSKGFGSRLIERGVTGHVGGSVIIDYAETGLVCVVEAPLEGFQRDG